MRILVFILLIFLLVFMYQSARYILSERATEVARRIAYAVSGFILGIPVLLMLATHQFSITDIDAQAWTAWALLAVIPVTLFWALVWILKGKKSQ